MKKGFFMVMVILAILIILGILFYPQKELGLSQKQVLEIIKPEIQAYCQNLEDNAIYSHCLICGGSYSGELEDKNYLYVTNFNEGQRTRYKYMIKDEGESYSITAQIYKIAGRNDRPAGNSILTFNLDKEGNILNSEIPEVSGCLTEDIDTEGDGTDDLEIGSDGTYDIQMGEFVKLNNGYSIIVKEYVSNLAVEYYKVSLFSPEGELIKDFTQGSVFENSLRNENLNLIGTLMFTPSTKSASGKSTVSVKSYSENDPVLYGTYTCIRDRMYSWVYKCKSIKEILEECGDLEFSLTDVCNE